MTSDIKRKGEIMTSNHANETNGTTLIVGASRGLGHAMAAEFLGRGWNVIGTVRGPDRSQLHDLADAHPGRVEIEHLDVQNRSRSPRCVIGWRRNRSTSCS